MGRVALVAAWLCSLAPGILDAIGVLETGGTGGQISQLGWALVPWIALAGLPAWSPDPTSTRPAVTWGLALPPLALAAALDHAAGSSWEGLAWVALPGLALIFLLALAAERGRVRPLAHGLVWLLLVPGAALCAWSLGLAGAHAPGLATLARLSPLTWALERASAAGAGELTSVLGPLGVAALCLLVTAGRRS